MNVAHIISGLNDGGAEAVLYRLCLHDKTNDHTVISFMDEGKYGRLLVAAGVTLYCLGMPRGRVKISSLWRLWRILRHSKPDVVQTWMYHADLIGGLVARFAGIKKVYWGIHHCILEPSTSRRSTILIARLCGMLSSLVPNNIILCSERSMSIHVEFGYDRKKFHVIHNGFDVGMYISNSNARARLRREWGVDDHTPLIGMVARFDAQKDHANLISALAILARSCESFKCAMVGSGIDFNNKILIKLIEASGVDREKILLLGRREDIPAVMNAIDLHVLSSSSEAFANVIAEAMACGTPCVATDVGIVAGIICDTGWVVPPRNAQALAGGIFEALSALKKNGPSWVQRTESARSCIVNRFTVEKMVQGYNRIWFE